MITYLYLCLSNFSSLLCVSGLLKGSTPGGPRNVVSQICENVTVKTVRSNRRAAASTIVTFDPLMEGEEDRDLIDADAVLNEIEAAMTGPVGGVDGGDVQTRSTRRMDSTTSRKSDDLFDDSEEWAKVGYFKTFITN